MRLCRFQLDDRPMVGLYEESHVYPLPATGALLLGTSHFPESDQIVDYLRIDVRRRPENVQSRPLLRSRNLCPHAHMAALARA